MSECFHLQKAKITEAINEHEIRTQLKDDEKESGGYRKKILAVSTKSERLLSSKHD